MVTQIPQSFVSAPSLFLFSTFASSSDQFYLSHQIQAWLFLRGDPSLHGQRDGQTSAINLKSMSDRPVDRDCSDFVFARGRPR